MVKKKDEGRVTIHQWQLIVVGLIFFMLGVIGGNTIAVASIAEVASNIQIGDININETKMVDAMFDYMNESGMLEEMMVENGKKN